MTVSPIRVDSLEAFGDLDSVAARLLAAEKAKVHLLFALSKGNVQILSRLLAADAAVVQS